jgi:hypothetical protein
MEKDIGRIPKNDQSEIVIRVDDFGGNRGLTIREFVKSENYTGFTKAGVRIKSEDFLKFKEMINSIDVEEMKDPASDGTEQETLDSLEEDVAPKEEQDVNPDEMPDY